MFGRDTPAKEARAAAVRAWINQRSPYALAAGALGITSFVDAIFVLPGVAAITFGVLGHAHIRRHPHLLGKRLCWLGVIGGCVGLTLAGLLYSWDRGVFANADSGAASEQVNPRD